MCLIVGLEGGKRRIHGDRRILGEHLSDSLQCGTVCTCSCLDNQSPGGSDFSESLDSYGE